MKCVKYMHIYSFIKIMLGVWCNGFCSALMVFSVKLIQFPLLADFVSCVNMKMPVDFLTVALGDSLTLNCTFNCSTGFVRGCWTTKKVLDYSNCHGKPSSSSFCTVSLHLSNVSTEDLTKNYTCFTQHTDDPQVPQKMERIVLLQLKGRHYYMKISIKYISCV